METLKVIVGNTVDFIVEVDGLSDSPTISKLTIFSTKKYPEGISDQILEVDPVSVSSGIITFTFDTEAIAPVPMVLYGHFLVVDGGKRINAYFKLKFTY